MKKIFFFAAALAATVSMNAQIEVFRPATYENPVITNDKETTGDVAAGTVYYTGTAFDVLNAFAAKPQYVNTYANDYDRVEFAGETIDLSTGLQACSANNPKDADGGNPAVKFIAPVSGGVFQVNAKAEGKMLVFHKASSNKNYMVFEEGSPLGYDFVEQTSKTDFEANGLLIYSVIGDAAEFNHYDFSSFKVVNGQGKEFTNDEANPGILFPEKYYEPAADVKANGLSVIAFDCAADITYLVHACGSKMSAAAFVYVPAGVGGDVVLKGKADAEVVPADLVLYHVEAGEVSGLNAVEAVKAIKKMVNGQLVIEKNGVLYNVLGAQL